VLLGSARAKAARKTLAKSTPGVDQMIMQAAIVIRELFIRDFAYPLFSKIYQNSIFMVLILLFLGLYKGIWLKNGTRVFQSIQCSLVIRCFRVCINVMERVNREKRGKAVSQLVPCVIVI